MQGLAEGAQLGALQGAAGVAGVAIGEGGLMGGWLEIGAGEQYEGVFFQGADPKVLKLSGVLIEVATVSLEGFGEAERQPVSNFVEGARALFGIVKVFRQKGLEAVPGFEPMWLSRYWRRLAAPSLPWRAQTGADD